MAQRRRLVPRCPDLGWLAADRCRCARSMRSEETLATEPAGKVEKLQDELARVGYVRGEQESVLATFARFFGLTERELRTRLRRRAACPGSRLPISGHNTRWGGSLHPSLQGGTYCPERRLGNTPGKVRDESARPCQRAQFAAAQGPGSGWRGSPRRPKLLLARIFGPFWISLSFWQPLSVFPDESGGAG